MSEEPMKPCPLCECPYGYESGELSFQCPECNHSWEIRAEQEAKNLVVKDVNGNELKDGDSVIVIKNLPVKGASGPIKAGTKLKKIRLSYGDHNIACKIAGFGAMGLKSEFVKKA